MIMSPDVVDTFKARARMTSAMRRLLDAQGFLEVGVGMTLELGMHGNAWECMGMHGNAWEWYAHGSNRQRERETLYRQRMYKQLLENVRSYTSYSPPPLSLSHTYTHTHTQTPQL